MEVFFEKVRPTSWFVMTVAVAVYAAVLLLSNVGFHGHTLQVIANLEEATNGWIDTVLPLIALCAVAPAIFGIGRLRPADVGWRASAGFPAIVVILLFWMGMQASLLLVVVLGGVQPQWDWWCHDYKAVVLAGLLVELIGGSLLEETFFRGYLLPQVFLKISRHSHKGVALVAALLISLGLFVLSHVPRLLYETDHAELPARLFWTFRFGLILTLTFLMTRNLFICVGLHSLWNVRPMLIADPRQSVEYVWWVLTTLLILGWWCGKRLGLPVRAKVRQCNTPR